MNTSRLVVGLVVIAVAVAMFLSGGNNYSTADAVGLGVVGLVSIAISRKKKAT